MTQQDTGAPKSALQRIADELEQVLEHGTTATEAPAESPAPETTPDASAPESSDTMPPTPSAASEGAVESAPSALTCVHCQAETTPTDGGPEAFRCPRCGCDYAADATLYTRGSNCASGPWWGVFAGNG